MKTKDIKRLETILKHYEKICVEFDKLDDSLMGEDTEMFSPTRTVKEVVDEFRDTAMYECNTLAGKLHAIKELSGYEQTN